MGVSPSLALYHLFGPLVARGSVQKPKPKAPPARPPGLLVWIHAPRENDHGVVFELIERLADRNPELWFLLTTEDGVPDNLPGQCFHQIVPTDTRAATQAFMSHWKPDLGLWVSGDIRPAAINAVSNQHFPLVLLDTGEAFEASYRRWYLPGLTRRILRQFDMILSGDEATSLALISAGARRDNVRTSGVLELGISALPCNDAEWETLTEMTATRPIWLAAGIDMTELGSVLAAHGQSMRRSHRLLLIIVPADEQDGDAFAETLEEQGMLLARRSQGGEPENNIQVYLADTQDEMGLWYRLAPVTYIGQTHVNRTGSGPDPFEAAALGSVVVHGPALSPHQVAYDRLARAGASRSVAHLGELAHAVESVLAPDRAAMMAHAAWQISTSGAEAMEETLEIIADMLGQGPGDDK